jgi:hypothetical protein
MLAIGRTQKTPERWISRVVVEHASEDVQVEVGRCAEV